MKQDEFSKCRDAMAENRHSLLMRKGEDYREGSDDVLANFKNMATRLDVTKYKTLGVYMGKHFDSIYKFCKDPTEIGSEPIESRIADAMNYLDFLHAMVCEDRSNNQIKN